MKKTLFGVLAFVLVLATLLTGSVFAARSDTGDTINVGTAPLVPANKPIQVDGKMDQAYTKFTPVEVGFYSSNPGGKTGSGVFTFGYAYFAWSKAENAVYCFVIMNDYEIGIVGASPWQSDSVELFIDWENTGTQAWGVDGLTGNGSLKRGLQYRISSRGDATCYLLEDDAADTSGDALKATYHFDPELGRFANEEGNRLINAEKNIFGWYHDPDDETNVDKGFAAALTEYGYTVEFKIEYGYGTLAAGQELGFDIQLNDLYTDARSGSKVQGNVYYNGTYRVKAANGEIYGNPEPGNNTLYYDYFVLGSEEVNNDKIFSGEELEAYGAAEATSRTGIVTTTVRTTTKKVTIDRIHTYKNTTSKNNAGDNSGNQPGGNGGEQGGNTQNPSGGTDKEGGCGSSIALGSSVAMVAMIGAAGLLTFRRKKEND